MKSGVNKVEKVAQLEFKKILIKEKRGLIKCQKLGFQEFSLKLIIESFYFA